MYMKNKSIGWKMVGTLRCEIPNGRPKSYWQRLNDKEKVAYSNWYKFTKLVFG